MTGLLVQTKYGEFAFHFNIYYHVLKDVLCYLVLLIFKDWYSLIELYSSTFGEYFVDFNNSQLQN